MNFRIIAVLAAAFVTISSQAVTLFTWSDLRLVGQVAPGINDTLAGNAAFVNSLVDRSRYITPSPFDVAGQTYLLFNSQGGKMVYADPTAPSAVGEIGSNHLVPNIGGYEFLVLTYQGVTGESYIINIRNLTGDLQVPVTDPRKNAHTRYYLFNAVPDAGSTAILLAVGFAGLALLHRKLRAA